ncbi:MAG: hypothetical protein IPM56_13895 [Ignavibacteriales bacterium]|nr:MAG: hypothetical protein IPM56_13895 [Ignavibacteriales bacterium]
MIKSLLSVYLFMLLSISLTAQYSWQQKLTGGGRGNPISIDPVNNNIIYYGSSNSIFKSTDRGETFTQFGSVIPQCSAVKCLHLNADRPGEIVASVYKGTNYKVVKSTDQGVTWNTTADNLSFSFYGIPSTQDPSHPDSIYLMNGNNFNRSTDFGSTWTTLTTSVGANSAPCDIKVFPDTSIILVGDNGTGIFKSTDYGLTWTNTYNTSGEIPTIAVDFNRPGTAWATKFAGGGGLIRSTDYGQTWVTIGFTGINTWGVHIHPGNSDFVATGTWSGSNIYITKDWGTNWITTTLTPSNYAVAVIDSMNVFAAQSGGFYKLTSPYFSILELSSFRALIEGLYNGTSMTIDTVTVELRSSSFPYSLIDQSEITLDESGNGSGRFYSALNSIPYYIVIKHKNSIETWSASPQSFSANLLTYDFTTGSVKAFGNNLKLINGNWCIYSGDVNQDGVVDFQDLNTVFTENIIGVNGNSVTDLNGDSFTEIDDVSKVFLNSVLGIERKRPIDFPE